MSIIRFNTEEVFGTDSQEYEILVDAANQIKEIPGAVMEIGTRRGGSTKIIMDTLASNHNADRSFFCIDPYGNIEVSCTNLNMTVHYPGTQVQGDPNSKEITSTQKFDYNNSMRNRVIPSLYFYAYSLGFNFTFFCLEDTEFFKRYADGVPVYNNGKTLENSYALVFFDGPHTTPEVMAETEFFVARSVIGSVFVYDDEWMLDTDNVVIPFLQKNGFEPLKRGKVKGSYVRTK